MLHSLEIVANLMPSNGFRPIPLANGLVYINPAMPGLRRYKRGDTFRYRDANGAWVRDPDQLARIRGLAIPPADKDVWIWSLQNGHLQATGVDGREDADLTPMMRDLGRLLLQMWSQTEQIIEELNARIGHLARGSDLCRRLQTIPGVGVLLATAIVSAIGNGAHFSRARDLSAWVGIVPRQFSTGGNTRLLGITKRGNSYLRRLFIQGARALWVWKDKHPDDPLQRC